MIHFRHIACAIGAGLMVLTWANATFAHAVLMASSPKAGEMLASPPAEVSVTFNENVGPIFFKVLDRTGKEVGSPGEVKFDGFAMILPLKDQLVNGTYVLTYRVISADTHPVGATFGFSVGEPMADTSQMSAAADAGSTPWTYAVAANRWLLYTTMLLAAGSALFAVLMNAPATVTTAAFGLGRAAATIAAVCYLLAIGLGGAEMVLGGARALFSADTWSRGINSTLTPSAAIGVPAMAVLIWAFRQRASNTAALLVGSAAAVASFLVTGHAATAAPVWLTAPTVAVHLVCAAFWLGALYPLLKSTQLLDARGSGAVMTAFSVRAAYSVGALVLSGVVISWVQLQTPGNLITTPYGNALWLKLMLVLVILGLAAYNKLKLTPALEKADPGAESRMRRSIRIEYGLYILILGAAIALTLTIPPRAIVEQGAPGAAGAMSQADGIKTSLKADKYTADVEISPARAGENMIMVTVKGADGQVLKISDLEIVANLEAAGISDLTVKGERLPNEMWHIMMKDMIIPGEWTLRVEAFVTDFDKVGFETKVQIK